MPDSGEAASENKLSQKTFRSQENNIFSSLLTASHKKMPGFLISGIVCFSTDFRKVGKVKEEKDEFYLISREFTD